MRAMDAIVGVWLMVSLGGCAGAGARPPQDEATASQAAGAYPMVGKMATGEGEQAAAPASGEETAAREATSPADRGFYKSEDTAPEPAPRERPGLGTEWGETRESHVRD